MLRNFPCPRNAMEELDHTLLELFWATPFKHSRNLCGTFHSLMPLWKSCCTLLDIYIEHIQPKKQKDMRNKKYIKTWESLSQFLTSKTTLKISKTTKNGQTNSKLGIAVASSVNSQLRINRCNADCFLFKKRVCDSGFSTVVPLHYSLLCSIEICGSWSFNRSYSDFALLIMRFLLCLWIDPYLDEDVSAAFKGRAFNALTVYITSFRWPHSNTILCLVIFSFQLQ